MLYFEFNDKLVTFKKLDNAYKLQPYQHDDEIYV